VGEIALMNEGRTGSVKLLRRLNKYELAVEIRVMREGLNNNKWDYRNLPDHYKTFLGQPILIAYVGKKIGDGHNMRPVRLPDGGVEYTFMDGTAERIIGTISENETDLRLEEIDGNLWMIAKGRIFAFYAREAVEKIRVTGTMDVSAETEIYEAETGENGVEIFTNWAGLGVTILGDDVPPAIPGARIKAMSVSDDLRDMNLRVASLLREADESPRSKTTDKGVKRTMNKRELAQIQKRFPGYTVLNASDDGMRVCLTSNETGMPCGYVYKDQEDMAHVFPERVAPMRVNAVFVFDSENQCEVDMEAITDGLNARLIAANEANETKDERIKELEEKVTAMEAQEQARRKSDAKKAVMSRLDVLNKNRDERCAYSKALAEEVCAKCESGCFNECMNEKGEWCGDAEAVKQLEALCARAQEQMDEETADKKRRVMSWNSINLREDGKPENNLDSLMDWVSKP
jgi:hypothetical protein